MAAGMDKDIIKIARVELTKRPLDCTRLDVYCMHGIVYLRGIISAMRGYDVDPKAEVEKAIHGIRSRMGVREVINELDFR